MSPAQILEIQCGRERYRAAANAGLTVAETARLFGVTTATVSIARRQYGLTFVSGRRGKPSCIAPLPIAPGRPTHMPSGETIRTAACAMAIYRAAQISGWNVSISDLAEAIGETEARVRRVCALKDWTGRLRATTAERLGGPTADDAAEAIAAMGISA